MVPAASGNYSFTIDIKGGDDPDDNDFDAIRGHG